MKTLFFLAVAAVLLTGCGREEQRQRSKDAMLIVLAQESVEAKLKDPASAEYRSTKVYRRDEKAVVCGEVNAKNGFGGYAGFQRFISAGAKETTFIESETGPDEMNKVWDIFCLG